MSYRYHDSATVSDEHGKGVEILRQQVVNLSGGAHTEILMIAEVDMIIRNLSIVGTVELTDGEIQFFTRASGAAAAIELTAVEDVDIGAFTIKDIPLSVDLATVKKGHILQATTTGVTPGAARLSVHVGWMPDMFGLDSVPRTF